MPGHDQQGLKQAKLSHVWKYYETGVCRRAEPTREQWRPSAALTREQSSEARTPGFQECDCRHLSLLSTALAEKCNNALLIMETATAIAVPTADGDIEPRS
jgi:hypothetical protein